MDIRKTVLIAISGTAALVVAVLIWRLDPVQENLRPQKFWANQVTLIELDVDYLRNKIAECTTLGQKVQGGPAIEAAKMMVEPGTRAETVAKLCSSYDEDLKAAVESLLAVKKKLKDAKG